MSTADNSFAASRRPVKAGAMPFFENLPTAEPAPPRRHHPWEPPEAEFPGIVPVDSLLLGRTDDVAVAVTGLSVFSAGMEIFLTARIRSSAGHGEEHLPGGPRDLAASRRSFRLGLQFADGGKPPGVLAAAGRTRIPSQRGRSCIRSPAAAARTRSSPAGGPGRCRPPGRWSSSSNGRRSASPNPGPAWMRSSSSTRPGAASGCGRKTKADRTGQVSGGPSVRSARARWAGYRAAAWARGCAARRG